MSEKKVKEKEKEEKIDIKALQKQNLSELKKYYKIKDSIGNNWLSKASKIYLISRKWLKSWKKYINKEYFDEKEKLKIKSFYNDGDEENPENFIIKPDLNMKKDIKMIHEDLWDFFHERYKGGPKLCYKQETPQKDNNDKALFQMGKTEIKIIFLPIKENILGDDDKIKKYFDEKNIKSLFIEKDKLISDLF